MCIHRQVQLSCNLKCTFNFNIKCRCACLQINHQGHHQLHSCAHMHQHEQLQVALTFNLKSTDNFSKISGKLNIPSTSMDCYWSLMKTLLNGKKVSCIPPIYVTDFKEKCQLLNSYFSNQCTLLKNISTLPNTCSKYTKTS